ncbi:hypothetical protein [Pseudomonas aeruginosa]|uniref:hypothetical protein n=1 Tax=Pseudomonas aeruginosa TaxID=287 RepID=UPI00071B6893|nr:hypothetical protein [Pseudomonas aeruginosa]EMB2839089.1 hypothetical protein [Pseudomonas aeruginosa]KSR58738.1 hypothetical protein APB46_19945 [Pseudomonas aeruginosa]OFB74660.1 hypothetical protein AN471_10665 [Pseudomonas aeruginosa]PNN33354.1 hypothetical protein AL512_001840 [Pseudomonas aeruginosa]HEH9515008.1 hypothetical protein [Pseudomonas aeruginosa]
MKVKLLLHTSAIFICSTTLALADEIGGGDDQSSIGAYWDCLRANYSKVALQSNDIANIQDKTIDACDPELRKHLDAVYLSELKKNNDIVSSADPAKITKDAEVSEVEHARSLIKTWHAGK